MAWVSAHKVWTAIIVIAFLLVLSGISNAGNPSQVQGDASSSTASAPTTAAPTTSSPSPTPQEVRVPKVVGESETQAEKYLKKAGLVVSTKTKLSHEQPGTVLSMDPSPGSTLPEGSSVKLVIARAYPKVPNVVGLSKSKATSKLKSAGYKVTSSTQTSSQPAGTVIAMSPSAGTELLHGKTVKIVVAKPAPPSTNNCTPGYSPCLVYHGGADYDCAGGSGDGPYYTAPGVTYRVTGSDPYGLDADHNGYGCE